MLRPYQQSTCNAALDYMRTTTSPCLIDAAPAAGKSHMIAYIADRLHEISGGKRILCLAPNAKLVNQNREKMQATGHPSSIFSASAGAKSTRHSIIFGTPGTVANSISRFNDSSYCAVVVDEAHGMTPTIRAIIEAMRLGNPNLRVLGLTGLGLIEMQRRRVRAPLHEVLGQPLSALSRGLAALRAGLRQARPGARLALTASPAVCAALRGCPGALDAFAEAAGPLALRPDPLCPPGQEHVHGD